NCSSNLTWEMTGATEDSGSGQVGTHTFNIGVTTITYTNTDGSSNTATSSKIGRASCRESPTVAASGDTTGNTCDDGDADCTGDGRFVVGSFGVNCSSNLTWEMTGATEDSGSGQVGTHTFNIGVTTITYTNTDGSSNTATSS